MSFKRLVTSIDPKLLSLKTENDDDRTAALSIGLERAIKIPQLLLELCIKEGYGSDRLGQTINERFRFVGGATKAITQASLISMQITHTAHDRIRCRVRLRKDGRDFAGFTVLYDYAGAVIGMSPVE